VAGRIYSVGYEGLTVDGLVERLTGARVSVVVDVRLNPDLSVAGSSCGLVDATATSHH
jgi:hypothetical protein